MSRNIFRPHSVLICCLNSWRNWWNWLIHSHFSVYTGISDWIKNNIFWNTFKLELVVNITRVMSLELSQHHLRFIFSAIYIKIYLFNFPDTLQSNTFQLSFQPLWWSEFHNFLTDTVVGVYVLISLTLISGNFFLLLV